jgi:anaphase-promoting complex subunit 4
MISRNGTGKGTPPGGRFPIGCPTLDLAVTWDQDDRNLLVYRPPDQVVSKIHQVASPGDKAPEVCAVTWRPDGKHSPCISIYILFCISLSIC